MTAASKTIRRKPALLPSWDKRLVSMLTDIGLIKRDFTGELMLTFHQGGVDGCRIVNRIK